MKNTGFWPQIAEMHMKGMISESQDSFIFHTQKSTKLLNLGYLVFFNSQNTFDVQTTCPWLQISILPDSSLCLLAAVHSGTFEMSSPRLEVLKISAELHIKLSTFRL